MEGFFFITLIVLLFVGLYLYYSGLDSLRKAANPLQMSFISIGDMSEMNYESIVAFVGRPKTITYYGEFFIATWKCPNLYGRSYSMIAKFTTEGSFSTILQENIY